MKKITRTMMAVLLVFCLTLSLAGCGQTAAGGQAAVGSETAADGQEASSSDASTESAAATAETGTETSAAETETAATSTAATETAPAEETAAAEESASSEETASAQETAAAEIGDSAGTGKTLVAYFSWSGNTAEMAAHIAEQTGADLLEIQPEVPYPEDYGECGEVAQAERDNNERPAIANLPDSLDEYDTLLIGYPIWWHTAPMIIGTFLESYDLTGMEVYPFTQSASMDTEQFDNSIAFVRESAANANVHDGLFVRSSDTEGIDAYLAENGLTADGVQE